MNAKSLDAVVTQEIRTTGRRATKPAAAASLILIDRDGSTPRVLMGRRHAGASFMPGRWVFPGGRRERADARAPAQSELSASVLSWFQREGSGGPKLARGLAIAAVRETFEETGLRLGSVAPDLAALRFVARAVTPPDLLRRFDARFFEADASALDGRIPRPSIELDEIEWLDFAETREVETATVTRLILAEAELRLENPTRPPLLLRMREGRRLVAALGGGTLES